MADLGRKIPVVGPALFGDGGDATFTTAPGQTQDAVPLLPVPEDEKAKKRRVAQLRGARRGRASTVLSIDNEPLGGY